MAKISDVVDTSNDEVHTSLPDNASGNQDHGDIVNDAMESATLDASLAELAGKDGDLDVSDLRSALGDEALELSDEELLKMWNEAKSGVEKPDAEAGEAAELPFPLYDDKGNKVTDFSKVTIQDLFSGKYQVAYQAMGKEQRKAFKELVRNASLGHYNESKMTTLQSERQRAMEMLGDIRKEHETWATDRKTWDRVLNAYVQGNSKPLEQLLTAYVTEMGKSPLPATDNPAQAQLEQTQQGYAYIDNTITPAAYDIAKQYEANPVEVRNAILNLIKQEPAEFLTQEKVDNILNHEIRVILEDAGYSANGTTPPAPTAATPQAWEKEVNDLRTQVQELKASQANSATNNARAKVRKAPASGGGSVSSAGDNMPAFKSRADMKKYLRGEE